MKFSHTQIFKGTVFLVASLLAACGGGGAAPASVTASYTVGGTTTGLAGTVVLQDNNGDNLTVAANGVFTFATQVANGSPYSVTVLTQPTGQSCSVASGTGTIVAANITNAAITCATNTYTIGGTVTGLNGSMVLRDNGGDNLTVAVNGPFTFATAVAYSNPYNVTVLTQPAGQTCTVTGGAGTATGNVTSVAATCSSASLLIGGSIQGNSLVLTTLVTTLAGNGVAGIIDGTGIAARFSTSFGITTDGTNLYVADALNNVIRKVVIATGAVTTLAGTAGPATGYADGIGTAAKFTYPTGITTDGINLFVTDHSQTIRKIVIATAAVTTLAGSNTLWGSADGIGAAARFTNPDGITINGTNLYVADTANNLIRKIDIVTGTVTTLAGMLGGASGSVDGIGGAAHFFNPEGITCDGPNLYVADVGSSTIRKIVIATAAVTTLAGGGVGVSRDGIGTAARFNNPWGVTTDGSNLYVVDQWGQTIRKIVLSTAVVTTLAGTFGAAAFTDGIGAAARFNYPAGITTDGTNLYVFDTFAIRKIQ